MTYKGTCGECRFYDDREGNMKAMGMCRRRSPQANEGQDGFPWTLKTGFCGDGELAAEPHSNRKPTMRQEMKEMNLEDEWDDALEAFANLPHRELAADNSPSALLTVAQEAYQFLLGLSDYEVPVGIHERLAAAILAAGGSLEEECERPMEDKSPCKYCKGTGKVHDAMGIGDECECPRCGGSAPSPNSDDAKNGPANTLRRNGR